MSERTREFEAVLEHGERALGWTIARLPFVPAEVWTAMVRLRVRGDEWISVSAFAISGRSRGFYLLVNKVMQNGAVWGWGRWRGFNWSRI